MMNRETFGAIDIGSNAIRLLIDYVEQYEDQRTEYKKAAFVRVPVRLGDDVFLRGHIGNDRAEALCDAMQGFAALLRAYGVRDYRACATSAMREAANSRDILERVRLRSGITVETISGEEEAETIFAAGGLKERLDPTKSYLYVDVGGGSTEIVVYALGRQQAAESTRPNGNGSRSGWSEWPRPTVRRSSSVRAATSTRCTSCSKSGPGKRSAPRSSRPSMSGCGV